MNVVDLSHEIEENMPVFPGTETPILAEANVIEVDGFREKKITMYSHTGTHMDAPAHILPGAEFLDQFPPDSFYGNALVVDFSRQPGNTIGAEDLVRYEQALSICDFLLIHTGWDRNWGRESYFTGFPVLTEMAARRLTSLGLKGVGIDAISVDPTKSTELPIHRILLGAGLLIIENLCNLGILTDPDGGGPAKVPLLKFSCFPLKIRGADGSPVRAVGIGPVSFPALTRTLPFGTLCNSEETRHPH